MLVANRLLNSDHGPTLKAAMEEGGLTSDSKWGEGGGVKTPFSQYLFIIFKKVVGLKPSSPSPSPGPVKTRTLNGHTSFGV